METKKVRLRTKSKRNATVFRYARPIQGTGTTSWRLPSGKALAEFALEAGLLAPPFPLNGPFWKDRAQPERAVAMGPPHFRGGGNGIRS
jgi:hypothetical protein